MSIDIDWTALTGGEDGQDLAETIRSFIHDRFQQIELPRMIRAVNVHTFDLGSIPPTVEIKDVLDPLPLFYQDSDDEAEEDEKTTPDENSLAEDHPGHVTTHVEMETNDSSVSRRSVSRTSRPGGPRLNIETRSLDMYNRHYPKSTSHMPTSATPGMLSGTSTLGYFHLPLSAGLSGTSTPLAAVAGGHHGSNNVFTGGHHLLSPVSDKPRSTSFGSVATPPSTTPTSGHRVDWQSPYRSSDVTGPESIPVQPGSSSDVQIVARVTYAGDIKLSLTAEILLDYPTPGFVNIPLKLTVTGLSFDGSALLAYTRSARSDIDGSIDEHASVSASASASSSHVQSKPSSSSSAVAHFCFVDPADEEMLGISSTAPPTEHKSPSAQTGYSHGHGPGPSLSHGHGHGYSLADELLREIQIESEIGKGGTGRQVLKNVDKVEKFILAQVRRIFRDEFVYPNYWSFLV